VALSAEPFAPPIAKTPLLAVSVPVVVLTPFKLRLALPTLVMFVCELPLSATMPLNVLLTFRLPIA